jgi:hypothetical protein
MLVSTYKSTQKHNPEEELSAFLKLGVGDVSSNANMTTVLPSSEVETTQKLFLAVFSNFFGGNNISAIHSRFLKFRLTL